MVRCSDNFQFENNQILIFIVESITGFCFWPDVGKATNVAKTEKKLIIFDEPASITSVQVIEAITHFQIADVILIVGSETRLDVQKYEPLNFISALPPEITSPTPENYLAYKEKLRFKAKFHARHLFNPVKTC